MSSCVRWTIDIHIQYILFDLQIEQMSSDILNQFMINLFRIELDEEVKFYGAFESVVTVGVA